MSLERRGGWLPITMAVFALVLLVLAALLMGGAGPTYRIGWLALGEAFEMLRYGAYTAVAAGGLGLIALITAVWYHRRTMPVQISALVIVGTIALMAVPFLHWQRAQEAPPIHDITTDTNDPPAFEALATAREEAPNAVDYPGQATARQQREAYPNIQPLVIQAPLTTVLSAAEAVVQDRGWEQVAVTTDTIEATATTTWFGFKDDVVIRLRETGDGVRVDMRSASRIGRGDMGTNAARIRDYLEALEQRMD
ncbi:hypothetical protein L861_16795 [Litchfieldella anticariensis FP35 = DSM 16096]|uniref:DUF1499 domain-containing protein n=1 Tax=Litchfieldella anticariensis (strain DSM 16096 / CECT 5854 / CIP 108499 / LMG 22089 / FP35) TaxID=1121939 RepID=S2L1J7_LITA3|nr:DUF1499 domain-containing protein [Halomonas anticariensis]EPC01529.1 hypothetical protein L861_16795 [Halomonas anticariensis FP35 = DSM 16096]